MNNQLLTPHTKMALLRDLGVLSLTCPEVYLLSLICRRNFGLMLCWRLHMFVIDVELNDYQIPHTVL